MAYSVVTTVLAPASSYALTDLATVKTELSISPVDTSNDGWLTLAIAQVSKAIGNYCNRVLVAEQVQDVFDIQQDPYPYQTPGGFPALQLSRWPVGALASVTQTLSTGPTPTTRPLAQDTDFRLDADMGQLLRLNPFSGIGVLWEALPVTVVYTAGYATIPDDLVEAALRLITARWWARERDPNLIQRETPGIGIERWWIGGAPGQKGQFTPEIQGLIDNYRVPVVV